MRRQRWAIWVPLAPALLALTLHRRLTPSGVVAQRGSSHLSIV
ncbi:hypothetical protein [Streptosporangium sp. NPDC051022]